MVIEGSLACLGGVIIVGEEFSSCEPALEQIVLHNGMA